MNTGSSEWAAIFNPDEAKKTLVGCTIEKETLGEEKLRVFAMQIIEHRKEMRERAMEAAESSLETFSQL